MFVVGLTGLLGRGAHSSYLALISDRRHLTCPVFFHNVFGCERRVDEIVW